MQTHNQVINESKAIAMEVLVDSKPESTGECQSCKLREYHQHMVTLQKCGHQFCLTCLNKHLLSRAAVNSELSTSRICTISCMRGTMCPACPWSPLALDDIYRIARALQRTPNFSTDKGQPTSYEHIREIGNSIFSFFHNQETLTSMMCNCSEMLSNAQTIGDDALLLEPTLYRIDESSQENDYIKLRIPDTLARIDAVQKFFFQNVPHVDHKLLADRKIFAHKHMWKCSMCNSIICGLCGKCLETTKHRCCGDMQISYILYKAFQNYKEQVATQVPNLPQEARRYSHVNHEGTDYTGSKVCNQMVQKLKNARREQSASDNALRQFLYILQSIFSPQDSSQCSTTNRDLYSYSLLFSDNISHVFGELAANDSFQDVADRMVIYREFIHLLDSLSKSKVGKTLICNPIQWRESRIRRRRAEKRRIINNSDISQSSESNQLSIQGWLSSLRDSLSFYLLVLPEKGLDTHRGQDSLTYDQNKEYAAISANISEILDRIKSSREYKSRGSVSQQIGNDDSSNVNEGYVKTMRKQCVVSDVDILHTFYFKKNVGSGRPLNMQRITKEISSLPKNLPCDLNSSIFVAIDQSHLTVLRAMILPSHDTPYAGGPFLFDIMLPYEYPKVPPKVQFLTTGGGQIRFNPNLYANGKVCLSLLGTWAGPGWVPGESTLLQLLLSIQSQIFVSDPYFNEPGYEHIQGTPRGEESSKQYNMAQRINTLRHALIPALKHPPAPFEAILRSHFKLLGQSLLSIYKSWEQEEKDFIQNSSISPNPSSASAPAPAPAATTVDSFHLDKFLFPEILGLHNFLAPQTAFKYPGKNKPEEYMPVQPPPHVQNWTTCKISSLVTEVESLLGKYCDRPSQA